MDSISARSLFDPLGTLSTSPTAPEGQQDLSAPSTGSALQQNPDTGIYTPTAGMMQLDLDPFGKRAKAKAEALGQMVPSDYVEELNVFGKRMTREQLLGLKGGDKLLDIATRNRQGVKGFWEGLLDHNWTVLLPFVGSITDIGTTIGDMNRVKETMKKMQNGEAVSDEDLVMARATIAQQERDSAGTTGAMIGGILSQAPAFAAEMVLTGGMFKAGAAVAKTALVKGTSYASKELVEATASAGFKDALLQAAHKFTDDAVKLSSRQITRKAAADLADDSMEGVLKEVAMTAVKKSGVTGTKAELDVLTGIAFNKVKASAVRLANPNYVKDAIDFVSEYGTKALLQHGDEAVWDLTRMDKSLVREMAGILTVQAPLQGAMYASVVEGVAHPLVSLATGNDGKSTSKTEMSLVSSALLQGDKKLMDRASRIAFMMQIGEYGSETTGRAFGLGIDAAKKYFGMGAGMGELIETAIGKAGSNAGYTRRATYMARQAIAGTMKIPGINEGAVLEDVLADPNLVRAAFRASVDREKGLTGLKFYAASKMMDMNLTPDAVVGFLRKAQINDVVEEMMEERYNGFYQGLFNLGDKPAPQSVREKLQQVYDQTVPDWKQFKAELFGFSAPMIARTAIFRAQSVLGGSVVSEAEHLPDALAHLYTGATGGTIISAEDQTKPSETYAATPVNPSGVMSQARAKLGYAEKGTDAVFLDQEIAETASSLVNIARGIRDGDSGQRGSVWKRGASSVLGVMNALMSGNPYMAFYDPVRAVMADNKLPAFLAEATRAAIDFHEGQELARRTEANTKNPDALLDVTPEAIRGDADTNERIQKHARELIKYHMQTQGVLPITNEDIDRVLDRMVANNVPFRVGAATLSREEFKKEVRDDLIKVAKGQMRIDESSHGTGSVFYLDRSKDSFITAARKSTFDAVYSIMGMPNLLDVMHVESGQHHNMDLNLGTCTVDMSAVARLSAGTETPADVQSVMFSLLGRDAASLTKKGTYEMYTKRIKAFARAFKASNELVFRPMLGRFTSHGDLIESIPIQVDSTPEKNQFVEVGKRRISVPDFLAEHEGEGYKEIQPKIHFTMARAAEFETAYEAVFAAQGYAEGDAKNSPLFRNLALVGDGPDMKFATMDEAREAANKEIARIDELAQRFKDFGASAIAYDEFDKDARGDEATEDRMNDKEWRQKSNEALRDAAQAAFNSMYGEYKITEDGVTTTHLGFEAAAQAALAANDITQRPSVLRPGTRVWTIALGAANTATDVYVPAKFALDFTYMLEETNEFVLKNDKTGRIIRRTMTDVRDKEKPGVIGSVKLEKVEYSPVMHAGVTRLNQQLLEAAARLRAEADTSRDQDAGTDLRANVEIDHKEALAKRMESMAANIFDPNKPTQEAFSKLAGIIFHRADKARFGATDVASAPGGYNLLALIAKEFRYNTDGSVNQVAAAFTAELDRLYGGHGFSLEEKSSALYLMLGNYSGDLTPEVVKSAEKFIAEAAEAVRTVSRTVKDPTTFTSEMYLNASGVSLADAPTAVDAELAAADAERPKTRRTVAVPAGATTHAIFNISDPEDAKLREAAVFLKVLERNGSLDPRNTSKYHGPMYRQAEYAWKQLFGADANETTVREMLKKANFKGGMVEADILPRDVSFSPVAGESDLNAEASTEGTSDDTRSEGGYADQAALDDFMFSEIVKLYAGSIKRGFPGFDARHPSHVIHQLVDSLMEDLETAKDKEFIRDEVLKGFISALRRNSETDELEPLTDLAMLQEGQSPRFQEWAEKLAALDAKREYKRYAWFIGVMEELPPDDKLVLLGTMQRISQMQPVQVRINPDGTISLGEAFRYPALDEANKAIARTLLDRIQSGKASRATLDALFGDAAVGITGKTRREVLDAVFGKDAINFGSANLFKDLASWEPAKQTTNEFRTLLHTNSSAMTAELVDAFAQIRTDLEAFFGVNMPWVSSFTEGAAARLVNKVLSVPGNDRKDFVDALMRISDSFFGTDSADGTKKNRPSNLYWNIHDSFSSLLLKDNKTHGPLTAEAIENVLVAIWRGTTSSAKMSANIAGGQSGILAEVQRAAAADTPPSSATMPGTGDKVNLIVGHPSAAITAYLDREGGIYQRQYAAAVKEATGVEPSFEELNADLQFQINREFGKDFNGEAVTAVVTSVDQKGLEKTRININSIATIEKLCRDSFNEKNPSTNQVFIPLFAGDSKRNPLMRFNRAFANILAAEGEALAIKNGYTLRATKEAPKGYDALYYAVMQEIGAADMSPKRKATIIGTAQSYDLPGKTEVLVLVNKLPTAGNEVLLGQMFVSGPCVEFFKKWSAVAGTSINKLHIMSPYIDGAASRIFMAKGVELELNESTIAGSLAAKAISEAFAKDATVNRISMDNDAMKEGPAMLKRVMVEGKAKPMSLSDYLRGESQAGRTPSAKDKIQWKEGNVVSEKSISDILPGFAMKDIDVGGNPVAVYSFQLPRAFAQAAANISHEAKPTLKSVATNVQGDTLFLTKPGESIPQQATILGILRLWVDVAMGRATSDTLKESLLGDWMGRVSGKSLELASELAKLTKSGLRGDVSPKTYTIQCPILTPNGKYNNVSGAIEWLTGSEHEKALVTPALLMKKTADIERYGKRRPGLARINVVDPSFRYGAWLDVAKVPGMLDKNDPKAVEDFIAGKVLELYKLSHDPQLLDSKTNPELSEKLMQEYSDAKREFFGMFVDADGQTSVMPSLKTTLDDLVEELPDGTLRFDYSAVFAGESAMPLADETTILPFLGGSFIHGVRTPSGDGGAAWALSRASVPVSYDTKGFPANDAAVIVDPVTLERIGADCDGDKFMAMIHKAVGPVGTIRRGAVPFAEAEKMLAIMNQEVRTSGKAISAARMMELIEQNPSLKAALFETNAKGETGVKPFAVDISNAIVDQLIGISKDMSTDAIPGMSTFGYDINTFNSGRTGVSPVPTDSGMARRLKDLLGTCAKLRGLDKDNIDLANLQDVLAIVAALRNVSIARGVGVSTLDTIETLLHYISGVRVDAAGEGKRAAFAEDLKTEQTKAASDLLAKVGTQVLLADQLPVIKMALTRGLADNRVYDGLFKVGLNPDAYRGDVKNEDGLSGRQRLQLLVHRLACCNNATYDEAKNSLASLLGFTSETFGLFQFSSVFAEAVSEEAFMDHLEKFALWVNKGPGLAYTESIRRSYGEPVGYYGVYDKTLVRVNPDKTVVTATGMVLQVPRGKEISAKPPNLLGLQIDAILGALRQLHGGPGITIQSHKKLADAMTQAAMSSLFAGKAEADVLAETTALGNMLYTISLLSAGADAVNFSRQTAFKTESARRTEQANYVAAMKNRGADLYAEDGIISAPDGIVSERSILGVTALNNLYQAIGGESIDGLLEVVRKVVEDTWVDPKGERKYPQGMEWNATSEDKDEHLRKRIMTHANVEGAISIARSASGMDATRLGMLIRRLSGVVETKALAGDPAAVFKASVEILFNKAFAIERTSPRSNPAFMQLVFDRKAFGDPASYEKLKEGDDNRFGEAKMSAIITAKSMMRLATVPGAADVGALQGYFAGLLNDDEATVRYFNKAGVDKDGKPLPLDHTVENSRLSVKVAPELTVTVTPSELYWLGFIYAAAAYDTRKTELDTSVAHLYPPQLINVMTDTAAAYRTKLTPLGLAEKLKTNALGLAYGATFENVHAFSAVDKVYFNINTESAALAALEPIRAAAREAFKAVKDEQIGVTAKVVAGYLNEQTWMPSSGRMGASREAAPASSESVTQVVKILEPMLAPAGEDVSRAVMRTVLQYISRGNFGTESGDADKTVIPAAMYLAKRYAAKSDESRKLDHLIDQIDRDGKVLQKQGRMKFITDPVMKQIELRKAFKSDFTNESEDVNRMTALLAYMTAFATEQMAIPSLASPSAKLGIFQAQAERILTSAPVAAAEEEPGFAADPVEMQAQEPVEIAETKPATEPSPAKVYEQAVNKAIQAASAVENIPVSTEETLQVAAEPAEPSIRETTDMLDQLFNETKTTELGAKIIAEKRQDDAVRAAQVEVLDAADAVAPVVTGAPVAPVTDADVAELRSMQVNASRYIDFLYSEMHRLARPVAGETKQEAKRREATSASYLDHVREANKSIQLWQHMIYKNRVSVVANPAPAKAPAPMPAERAAQEPAQTPMFTAKTPAAVFIGTAPDGASRITSEEAADLDASFRASSVHVAFGDATAVAAAAVRHGFMEIQEVGSPSASTRRIFGVDADLTEALSADDANPILMHLHIGADTAEVGQSLFGMLENLKNFRKANTGMLELRVDLPEASTHAKGALTAAMLSNPALRVHELAKGGKVQLADVNLDAVKSYTGVTQPALPTPSTIRLEATSARASVLVQSAEDIPLFIDVTASASVSDTGSKVPAAKLLQANIYNQASATRKSDKAIGESIAESLLRSAGGDKLPPVIGITGASIDSVHKKLFEGKLVTAASTKDSLLRVLQGMFASLKSVGVEEIRVFGTSGLPVYAGVAAASVGLKVRMSYSMQESFDAASGTQSNRIFNGTEKGETVADEHAYRQVLESLGDRLLAGNAGVRGAHDIASVVLLRKAASTVFAGDTEKQGYLAARTQDLVRTLSDPTEKRIEFHAWQKPEAGPTTSAAAVKLLPMDAYSADAEGIPAGTVLNRMTVRTGQLDVVIIADEAEEAAFDREIAPEMKLTESNDFAVVSGTTAEEAAQMMFERHPEKASKAPGTVAGIQKKASRLIVTANDVPLRSNGCVVIDLTKMTSYVSLYQDTKVDPTETVPAAHKSGFSGTVVRAGEGAGQVTHALVDAYAAMESVLAEAKAEGATMVYDSSAYGRLKDILDGADRKLRFYGLEADLAEHGAYEAVFVKALDGLVKGDLEKSERPKAISKILADILTSCFSSDSSVAKFLDAARSHCENVMATTTSENIREAMTEALDLFNRYGNSVKGVSPELFASKKALVERLNSLVSTTDGLNADQITLDLTSVRDSLETMDRIVTGVESGDLAPQSVGDGNAVEADWVLKAVAELPTPGTEAVIAGLNVHEGHMLVSPMAQPRILLADPAVWFNGTMLPNFRGTSPRDILGDHSAEASIVAALNTADFLEKLMGLSGADGSILTMSVGEHDLKFGGEVDKETGKVTPNEGGKMVRREEGEKGEEVIRFGRNSSFRKVFVNQTFTQEELALVHYWLKTVEESSYSSQTKVSGAVESVIVGHKINFLDLRAKDLYEMQHDAAYFNEFFSREAMDARLASSRVPEKQRDPGAETQFDVDILFRRIEQTLPAALQEPAKNAVLAALRTYIQNVVVTPTADNKSLDVSGQGEALSTALDTLYEQGFCAVREKNVEGVRRRYNAVLALPFQMIDNTFQASSARAKLIEAGRPEKYLTAAYISSKAHSAFAALHKSVSNSPWLSGGLIDQVFTMAGTRIPTFRGNGLISFAAKKALVAPRPKGEERIAATTESFLKSMEHIGRSGREYLLDPSFDGPIISMLCDLYGISDKKESFFELLKTGHFDKGEFGFKFSANATRRDAISAIYRKSVEIGYMEARAGNNGGVVLHNVDIDQVIRAYETRAAQELGGKAIPGGLTPQELYKIDGILPANLTVTEKLREYAIEIANAERMRGGFCQLMMTADAYGRPLYYASPVDGIPEADVLPDLMWSQLARWWAESNGTTYDSTKSGRDNARLIYDKIRQANKGASRGALINYVKDRNGNYAENGAYTELGSEEIGLASVSGLLCMKDDPMDESKPLLDVLSGGYAAGYMRQLLASTKTRSLANQSSFISHVLSWSKSLSVSMSFFFPLATKYESAWAAVGPSYWSKNPGELLRKLSAGGDAKFYDKSFANATYGEIYKMINSNDACLVDLQMQAAILDMPLSSPRSNPMEQLNRSHVTNDIERTAQWMEEYVGKKNANGMRHILRGLVVDPGERSFEYMINATKLATMAQLNVRLREAALAQGKAWDPILSMRKYSHYINAEVGGVDPAMYPFATPQVQWWLNVLMFSWQWTIGAWDAGGGGVLTRRLFGMTTTKESRAFMFGRWLRMYTGIMVGVPMVMQLISKAIGKAAGTDDDDDKWGTWQNEDKEAWNSFNITPMLKAIAKIPGVVDFKKEHPIIGGIIPAYTGANSTGRRKVYMHFGKQGWEVLRWFTDPVSQAISKQSIPLQKFEESLLGYNLGLGVKLPWAEQSVGQRLLDFSSDGALMNVVAGSMLPFSASSIKQKPDVGILSWFGPITSGVGYTQTMKNLTSIMEEFADSRRASQMFSSRSMYNDIRARVRAALDDAAMNGIDPETALNAARGQVIKKYYKQVFDALPKTPDGEADQVAIDRAFRAMYRIKFAADGLQASIRKRYSDRGIKPRDIPNAEKNRQAIRQATRQLPTQTDDMGGNVAQTQSSINQSFLDPDGTGDPRRDRTADLGGNVTEILASDDVPASILGFAVVMPEELAPADLAFFEEYPDAAGFYDTGTGPDDDDEPDDDPPGPPGGSPTDQVTDQVTDQAASAADKGGHVELLRQMEYRPDGPGQAVSPPPKMPDAEPEAVPAKKDPREEAVIKWALNALFSKESKRTLSPKDADYNSKTGELEAVGPYQIHRGHVDEANKILKKQGRTDFFTYDDRRDFWKAKQITEAMLRDDWANGVRDPLELAGRHRLPAGPSVAADSWRSPEHKKYMRELRRLLKETPVESFMDTPGKE